MTKGRGGTLASSTCNRESHFWQTIIMTSLKVEDLESEGNYSIILNIEPGSGDGGQRNTIAFTTVRIVFARYALQLQ